MDKIVKNLWDTILVLLSLQKKKKKMEILSMIQSIVNAFDFLIKL